MLAGHLRAEFALATPKSPDESYAEEQRPEFVVVRTYRGSKGEVVHKRLRVRRKRVLIAPTEVAIVISLLHDPERQWQVAKALLANQGAGEADGDSGTRAPQKLRDLGAMVDLVGIALLCFDLAREGRGPTEIGSVLFPRMARSAAKTKSRDLLERGRRYVESGFITFALESLQEGATSKRRRVRKSKATARSSESTPAKPPTDNPKVRTARDLIISPLPALPRRAW